MNDKKKRIKPEVQKIFGSGFSSKSNLSIAPKHTEPYNEANTAY